MPLRWGNARLRKEIGKICADWAETVLLGWDVEVKFNEQRYLAAAEAKPRYEEMIVYVNLRRIRKEISSLTQLEALIVHELAHGLTWTLAKGFDETVYAALPKDVKEHFEENATTQITKALLRARKRG